MTAIAVTGCTGFVGSHLRMYAGSRGHRLCAIPREALQHPKEMLPALAGTDAVIHLAARAHQLMDHALDRESVYDAANVGLTRNVALACLDAGVRRLIFVSSAGVLGNQSPPPGFSDDSVPAPHDAYTRSKLAAETLLLDYAGNEFEVCIVRPPLVYGPGAPGNVARLWHAVIAGWPLPVGRLRAPRSMVSVRNLCDLLLALAGAPGKLGEPMLVADEESTSVQELVRMVAAALGRSPRIVAVPVPLLAGALRLVGHDADVVRLLRPFVVRASRARTILGWHPPYRLRDEIAWMAGSVKSGEWRP